MTTEPYNYELIAQHPRLLALYIGWLGQKIYFLTHSAVTWDQSDLWPAAASEMERLVLVLHCGSKAQVLNLSDETGAAFSKLVGYFAAGGWWTSRDGTRERMACKQARRKQEEFPDHELDPGDAPFRPQLLLERDSVYSVAPTVIDQLDAVLMQTAVAMDNLDVCRLGVSLSGFCYRSTLQLGVPFIDSVLNNLSACDMTDLESENEFGQAVGLAEVSADRRLRSVTDLTLPPPIVPEDVTAGGNRQGTFGRYVGDMTDQRGLILACVFDRFDVMVPPAESDASQYPELPRLKKTLHAASVKATKPAGKASLAEQTEFWTQEAIEYLGFNRLDMARPDMLLQRLIKKGALRPTKIGRRNMFKKADLDRIREKGDQVRRRGRPRKDEK